MEISLESKTLSNIVFIDGQNLHLGTKVSSWAVDHIKLRTYLREKYNVEEAHYFLGFVLPSEQDLYDRLQKAGFVLNFREHLSNLQGNKKGNVDCDIIFHLMKKMVDNEPFEKAFIVSGDGDYKKLVNFLVKKGKFGKMLFPNRDRSSSLYDVLGSEFFDFLDSPDVRTKIEYTHRSVSHSTIATKKKAP